jgi:NAD(P)-dependent dehydrogenase (short-subunit alcohol dehydrogenase family)
MDLLLTDKVAVVTGSTGICRAAAQALAEENANLAITYLTESDKKAAKESIKICEHRGQKGICLHLDVRDLDEISSVIDKVLQEFGKIDVLVNSAGVSTAALAEEVSEKLWDLDVDIDLKGLFFCCKEVFVKAMKKQRYGNIINISSVCGVKPVRTNPMYGAAKAGVINITQYLAVEWGNFNIRVNAISPGWIDNFFELPLEEQEKWADNEAVSRTIPMGRFGKAIEIGRIISFLASERSSFINGSNIIADGGMIAGIRLASLKDGKIEMF